MNLRPKKGDLVYLPADITLVNRTDETISAHSRVTEPVCALVLVANVNNENIYHKVHVQGADWYVRTIDALEVMSRV